MSKEVIAVDLGGTNLRAAHIKNGKIVDYVRKPTSMKKEELLKDMFELISGFMGKGVKGIGIACPGPLKDGVIKNPPNIPLKNYDLKGVIKKKFKVRVEVENDASCVALAEYKLGVKKKNFFVLTLGTGVGGGIIIDGKLYNREGLGGELGSIYLTQEKTLQDLVGARAIGEITKEAFGSEMNVGDLVKMKDSKSKKIVEEIANYLGQGIGSLINIFDPEVVVLAGGMRHSGPEFLEMIREKTKKYILLEKKFDIVWSKLEHAGCLGAGLLLD